MENVLTYEQAMERLEQVVKELEDGSGSLDGMLALYEEGKTLADYCSKKLEEYEGKLTKLTLNVSKEEAE